MGLDFLGVGAKYESQDLHREDQIVASLAPRDWTVNIQLSKLPIKETGNAIMEILFAGVGIQDEPMIPFPQIMAAMGRAGSEVLIDSLSLVGPLVSLDGNAKATVDPASALGAVGGATLKLIGLARLEAAMADFPKDMQQEIAGGLVFLKGLGAPEPDGDDIDYVYVFDVPADGNVTLNGQPMGALLGRGSKGAGDACAMPAPLPQLVDSQLVDSQAVDSQAVDLREVSSRSGRCAEASLAILLAALAQPEVQGGGIVCRYLLDLPRTRRPA